MYTTEFWLDGDERGCALAGPGQPRFWACGEVPSGGVFSRADLDRLLEAQQAPMRELAAQMDALQEAYATACVAPDADLQGDAASLLAQLETIRDLAEPELLEVVRPALNQFVGRLCAGAATTWT